MPTSMRSVAGNHTMDFFYLLKDNFKKSSYLTHKSREGASRICLIFQVVRCHKDRDSEEYTLTYYETLNQTFLTQKYWGRLPINLRSGSLLHPLRSSMLTNKQVFSLVISKLMYVFFL